MTRTLRDWDWLTFLMRGACLLACLAFLIHAIIWTPRLTHGFAMYYTYSRMVLEGEPLSRLYDQAVFNSKIREYGFDVLEVPNNLPTSALAFLPVGWLQPHPAKVVSSILSLAALAFALKILFTLYGIRMSERLGLVLLTLVFLWKPAYENTSYGQIYFILLVFFALSMRGMMRDHATATACPLALAFLLKGYGLIPIMVLAVRRRWRAAGLSLGLILVGAIATLPLLGVQSWIAFGSTVMPSLGQSPPDAHVAYQEINGLIRHLFTYDSAWLPHPLVVLPGPFVTIISYGLNLAVVLFVIVRSRFAEDRDLPLVFSAALAVGVVTSPIAEEYHYVLFLPLLFGLAARFAALMGTGQAKKIDDAIAAVAVFLLAVPLHYKALQYSSFPIVLLGYPKLYAGIALLWYYSRVITREHSSAEGEPVPTLQ